MNNCLNFTQTKNEDFKKIEKRQEKAIRIINFLPLNAPLFAPNNPWCKMLQTLLGRKKHEEEMSDEQPLKLYSNKKWRSQKDRKTSRKNNKNNKSPPFNAPVEKQKYEMNILKLKEFIILRNILFVKGFLNENALGSFNDEFHSSKLPPNHTTRSSSTCKLK